MKQRRTLHSSSLLALCVGIAVLSLGWHYMTSRSQIEQAIDREDRLQAATALVTDVLQAQLEQQAALRVYAKTHLRLSRDRYVNATDTLVQDLNRLRDAVKALSSSAVADVFRAEAANRDWR